MLNFSEKMWLSLFLGLLLGILVNVGSHLIIHKYFIKNNKKE